MTPSSIPPKSANTNSHGLPGTSLPTHALNAGTAPFAHFLQEKPGAQSAQPTTQTAGRLQESEHRRLANRAAKPPEKPANTTHADKTLPARPSPSLAKVDSTPANNKPLETQRSPSKTEADRHEEPNKPDDETSDAEDDLPKPNANTQQTATTPATPWVPNDKPAAMMDARGGDALNEASVASNDESFKRTALVAGSRQSSFEADISIGPNEHPAYPWQGSAVTPSVGSPGQGLIGALSSPINDPLSFQESFQDLLQQSHGLPNLSAMPTTSLAMMPPASHQASSEPSRLHVSLSTPLYAPAFAPDMAAQLTLLAQGGVQLAHLQLNPAEMGPVNVQIHVDERHQTHVEFRADNATTRAILERSLPDLAAALSSAGLTLSGGGVFQQQSHSHGQAQSGASTSPPSAADALDNAKQPPPVFEASIASRALNANLRGGVDEFV